MDMKFYGYKDRDLPVEDIEPDELAEITLVATPDELRKIARFLESAADKMEQRGKGYSHEHLSDLDKTFRDSPHFVVFNPGA